MRRYSILKPLLSVSFSVISLIAIVIIDAKAASAQETTATFAVIGSGGVIPVADAPVFYVPCAPINNNCQQIKNYLTEKIGSAKGLSQSSFQEMNARISQQLLQLRNAQEGRTNLSGTASIDCPTQDCLVYASSLSEAQNLFWLDIQSGGSNQEYPPSRAIQIKTETMPTEISSLIDEINRFRSVVSAGVSYQNFSEHYAPLIHALNLAGVHASNSKYSRFLTETQRAIMMFDLTKKVWQAYIESTSVNGFETTHMVSCDYARSVRELWNDVVGFEDMRKVKGGLLGCLFVDLDKFESPSGKTTWHKYMFDAAFSQLLSASRHLDTSSGAVPNIELPKL